MQLQSTPRGEECQSAPPRFAIFRTSDLCQFGADATAIATAHREAWESAHRELRERRGELQRLIPQATPQLVDDALDHAAREAGLLAVIAAARKMLESPTPDAESVLRPD